MDSVTWEQYILMITGQSVPETCTATTLADMMLGECG